VDYTTLAESTFTLDAEQLEGDRSTGAGDVIDDRTVSLITRENRVALAQGTPTLVEAPTLGADRRGVDVPLLFVLQAHPECVFTWARLIVDFAPTPGVVINDLSPRGVEDIAVEIETKVGVGLEFSLAAKAVDVKASPEVARKRNVYLPTLTAAGAGFHKGYWDFMAKAGDYLYADKELRLLLTAPNDSPVRARITVRAKVRFRGVARLIPLLARVARGGYDIELIGLPAASEPTADA
jgi:hypothetical protein